MKAIWTVMVEIVKFKVREAPLSMDCIEARKHLVSKKRLPPQARWRSAKS